MMQLTNNMNNLSGVFAKYQYTQEDYNQYKCSQNLNISIDLPDSSKVSHFFNPPSSLTVISRKIVPNMIFTVNASRSAMFFGNDRLGKIIAAPYQPAERLMESPASDFNQARERCVDNNLSNLSGLNRDFINSNPCAFDLVFHIAFILTPLKNWCKGANSWLVIDVASLSVPEKLLALLPLAVFMPRVMRKWRERKRG